MVTVRLTELDSTKAAPGDLVFVSAAEEAAVSAEADDEEESEETKRGDSDSDDETETSSRGQTTSEKLHAKVKVLTDKDCHLYSISDVVLPLPGHAVRFPENIVGERFKSMIEADGLSMKAFSDNTLKDFRLAGDYRKIVAKPKDFDWKIVNYDDASQPLSETDMDQILKLPLDAHVTGSKKAVLTSFSLPSSAYATMAVRELTKKSTQRTSTFAGAHLKESSGASSSSVSSSSSASPSA